MKQNHGSPASDGPQRRSQITHLLQNGEGHENRLEELLPLIYEELRSMARARMAREGAPQTMQATALVHEAYLRLVGDGESTWKGRRHFFGAAALAMRRILVERARRRNAVKRGGQLDRVEWDEAFARIEPPEEFVLEIDELVGTLEQIDPRKGQIVNLRYFVGLTAQETADAMQLSLGTIEREWRFIKAWLKDKLQSSG